MYSVAQVAHPDFARSWHEAVAIVQEVASQLDPGTPLPDPEDLLLDDEGNLTFGFPSESAENPIRSLGRLLRALLEGTGAPAGLRELAEENTGDQPSHTTL